MTSKPQDLAELACCLKQISVTARAMRNDLIGYQNPDDTPRAVRDQHDHQAALLAQLVDHLAIVTGHLLRHLSVPSVAPVRDSSPNLET